MTKNAATDGAGVVVIAAVLAAALYGGLLPERLTPHEVMAWCGVVSPTETEWRKATLNKLHPLIGGIRAGLPQAKIEHYEATLAELRAWTASLPDRTVAAEYNSWLRYYDNELHRPIEREREEDADKAKVDALTDCLPTPLQPPPQPISSGSRSP